MVRNYDCYMERAEPQSYKTSLDGMLFGGMPRSHVRSITIQRSFNSHNNFLAEAGYLSSNQTNFAKISIPKGYNHITVYLFHGQTSTKR